MTPHLTALLVALLLAGCARPAPPVAVAPPPPPQPRADPIALITADEIVHVAAPRVRAETYVELDGQWPAELAFIVGEDEGEGEDADWSNEALHVYGFSADGEATRLYSMPLWYKTIKTLPVDTNTGRHALLVHHTGGHDKRHHLIGARDGRVQDLLANDREGVAILPLDEDGDGVLELFALEPMNQIDPSPIILGRQPDGGGYWGVTEPLTSASKWLPRLWTNYLNGEEWLNVEEVLPRLLQMAHEEGVDLTLTPEHSARLRAALADATTSRERYTYMYALLDADGDVSLEELRGKLGPADDRAAELTLLWYAFALSTSNASATRDAFITQLETHFYMGWSGGWSDGTDHTRRLAGMITDAFVQADDVALIRHLRTPAAHVGSPNEKFVSAWSTPQMLSDLITYAPTAEELDRLLYAFDSDDASDAARFVGLFEPPQHRKALETWLSTPGFDGLYTICTLYAKARASRAPSPCTEEHLLAALEDAAANGGDLSHVYKLPDTLKPALRPRYDALLTADGWTVNTRFALMRRLYADDLPKLMEELGALRTSNMCADVHEWILPKLIELPSPEREAALQRMLTARAPQDLFEAMELLSCFAGIEESTRFYEPIPVRGV